MLQNIFYVLGIMYMVLGIIITLAILFLLLFIKKKVTDIHDLIENKVNQISEKLSSPAEVMTEVGSVVKGFLHKNKK